MMKTMTASLRQVLVGVILSGVSIIVGVVGIVASSCRPVVVVVIIVASPCSHCCPHRPCLHHHRSRCCCRQRCHCSPPSMVGCCVAYSVVCRPICHPPLSSSCDHQHVCRRPPSLIAKLRQPLSYQTTLPLPLMDGWQLCSLPAQQHTN